MRLILLLVLLAGVARAQGLLPLDDRPCNLLFVRQIARIAGVELEVPPRGWLGRHFQPGDPARLTPWLEKSHSPLLFVSSDMLCYGGLVASRTAAVSQAQALERLQVLERLHAAGRRVQVLATLPRLALRTSDEQAPYEQALARWAAQPDLPRPPYVEEYLAVRERNLAVLLALIELERRGVLERLVIGQDDSAPTGLVVGEQKRLREAMGPRVVLLSGADELAMDMVAGWLAGRYGVHPTVNVVYDDPEAAHLVPPLESLPLSHMVSQHLALAGAVEDPAGTVCLMVQTPLEHPFRLPDPSQEPHAQAFVDEVVTRLGQGPVALANLGLINRMDPYVAQAALDHLPIWRLEGLAGWNTPANALGTAVAQLVARQVADHLGPGWTPAQRLESASTHVAFLLARMLDDYAYQAVLRNELYPRGRELPRVSDPLLNLYGPLGLEARVWLREWLLKVFQERWRGQAVRLPGGGWAFMQGIRLEVVLPWPRLFEVEARLQLKLGRNRP